MPSLNAEESRGRTLPSMLKLYLILVSSVVLVIICPNGNHNTIVGSTLYQVEGFCYVLSLFLYRVSILPITRQYTSRSKDCIIKNIF